MFFNLQRQKRQKFSDSGILKAANNILTVSYKIWQKKAMEWGRPCQPFMIYSEMWALEDPAPQQSVISEFLQWRMIVQRLCFAHTLLDLFYHADICWSSFLIYWDNLKWEHLLIHDYFFIAGLDSILNRPPVTSVFSVCGYKIHPKKKKRRKAFGRKEL